MRCERLVVKSSIVIRPCGVGDTVLMLPFLEALSAEEIVFMGRPDRSGFLAGRSAVGRVISMDSFGAPSLFSGQPSAEAKGFFSRFDTAVAFMREDAEEFRRALLRAGVREAHGLDISPRPAQHACDRAVELAAGLGLPAVEAGAVPRLRVLPGDVERARGEGFREGVWAVHPGSGGAKKNWPVECFAEVARALSDVLFLAGPAEEERLREIEDSSPGRLLLSPDWELLVGVLALARGYVGNDSGITHLAAALGVPTVAVFGPTDPAVWTPRGRKVKVLRGEGGRLDAIEPADVLEGLEGLQRLR